MDKGNEITKIPIAYKLPPNMEIEAFPPEPEPKKSKPRPKTVERIKHEVGQAPSAVHWFGNQVCSIDIETSGPDPWLHEILQIAILPLTSDFKIRKNTIPFYINIMPEYPQLAAFGTTRKKMLEVMNNGFESEAAKDLLYKWVEKLHLPLAKDGTPKQIYPLGHNYTHDRAFMLKWLGYENYNEFFGPRILDSMTTAIYLNDRATFHGVGAPFSRVDLTWLAGFFNIDTFGRHDALVDTKITAELYRNLCQYGAF